MGESEAWPTPGVLYNENREPYTVGVPREVPEGFIVHEENIVSWSCHGEFYVAHEIVVTTPAGKRRSFLSLLQQGDLGAARIKNYRTLAETQREAGTH